MKRGAAGCRTGSEGVSTVDTALKSIPAQAENKSTHTHTAHTNNGTNALRRNNGTSGLPTPSHTQSGALILCEASTEPWHLAKTDAENRLAHTRWAALGTDGGRVAPHRDTSLRF